MRIATALLMLLSAPAWLAARDGADSLATYALGEVVVTAQGGAIVATASIAEVGEAAVRLMDVTNAAAALRTVPSVFLSQNSRNESFLVLRGYDQRQIAVYMDGVPISVPYNGLVDLGMIPSGGLGKITVTKGMPSVLYGANGMGGTINLVTIDRQEGLTYHLRAQAGPTRSVSFSHRGSTADLFWMAAGSYTSSSGYTLPRSIPANPYEDGGLRENSQAEGYGALFKLGTTLLPGSTTGLTVFHTLGSKGIPPSISSVRPRYWRFPEWGETLVHLTNQTALGSAFVVKGSLFFEKYRNVLDGFDDQTYSTQTRRNAFHSTYDDDSYGAALSATMAPLTSHLTRIALLFKNDIHREQEMRNAPWERYATFTMTLGAEHEVSLNPVAVVAGVSHDRLRPTDANMAPLRPGTAVWNGHAGVRYRAAADLELRANVARRSRFPTLKELYSEVMGKNIANPALEAERSWNTEIGCSWKTAGVPELSLTLFRNEIDQLIFLTTWPDGTQQFQNVGSARYSGLECGVKGELGRVEFNCQYTYLDARSLEVRQVNGVLPYRPRHLITCTLSGSVLESVGWRAEYSYVGIHHGVNMDNGAVLRLPDYGLLNARVSWRPYDPLVVFLRVDNMLDRYYESEIGFPQAGRQVCSGIDVDF